MDSGFDAPRPPEGSPEIGRNAAERPSLSPAPRRGVDLGRQLGQEPPKHRFEGPPPVPIFGRELQPTPLDTSAGGEPPTTPVDTSEAVPGAPTAPPSAKPEELEGGPTVRPEERESDEARERRVTQEELRDIFKSFPWAENIYKDMSEEKRGQFLDDMTTLFSPSSGIDEIAEALERHNIPKSLIPEMLEGHHTQEKIDELMQHEKVQGLPDKAEPEAEDLMNEIAKIGDFLKKRRQMSEISVNKDEQVKQVQEDIDKLGHRVKEWLNQNKYNIASETVYFTLVFYLLAMKAVTQGSAKAQGGGGGG